MVKIKEGSSHSDGIIDLEQWLSHISSKRHFQDNTLLRNACTLSQLCDPEHTSEHAESCLQSGLSIADILSDLEVDQETLAAAIIYNCIHQSYLTLEDAQEQLGREVAQLVKGVEKMNIVSVLEGLNQYSSNKSKMDNVRKMLLAMVDDVRVVLIKLAERLYHLRLAVNQSESIQKQLGKEVMELYAPLANRLGIGSLKWEMEDLAFRYLQPADYKQIAKELNAKRTDRDRYVHQIVAELKKRMSLLNIPHFEVYGRSKHIHSIYRKMIRKNLSFKDIYDVTAVRILVDNIDECYQVLSLVHELWEQIPAEYDDYIAHPKPNGYQSLHTAVIGPENRAFEVQIRTFKMHALAEMGIAAHWKYKEGGKSQQESHERKIEWLREVLSWHREVALNKGYSEEMETQFLEDRVYIFTPNGDVLDLPKGVTSLDFAYHVHSQIGHRCRGAKVNGHIVPLTYELKTGERVEILTGKEEKPSLDWINPHLNYLKTARAKAKVLHWFKMQDYDQNRADGHDILEKELKSLGLKADRLQHVAELLHFKRLDDLLASLGRGDTKLSQIISRLTPAIDLTPPAKAFIPTPVRKENFGGDLCIEGVGNLMTNMAKCCQPLPGDEVIGYITLGRGVSIHRRDCANIIHATERQRKRFLQVNWGSTTRENYMVDLIIKAFDRPDLLRDLTTLLSHEKTQVVSLQTQIDAIDNMLSIQVTLKIDGLTGLSRLLAKITQIPNIWEARRTVL